MPVKIKLLTKQQQQKRKSRKEAIADHKLWKAEQELLEKAAITEAIHYPNEQVWLN